MKKYEIVYIIHPDLEGSIDKITEKVKDAIKKAEGVIINEEDWGKKKLAYAIKKSKLGIYHFLVIEIDSSKVRELERTLRLSEEIIRSMVVLSEEPVSKESEKKKIEKKVSRKPTEGKRKEQHPKTQEKPAPDDGKGEKPDAKEEKERLEALDEKLKEIIGTEEEN